MAQVNYITSKGETITIDVQNGHSIMEGAVSNGLEGIIGECGGVCSCATCHAYVDEKWLDIVGEAEDDEADMLDFLESRRRESRLACQIIMSEELDGITVTIPESED